MPFFGTLDVATALSNAPTVAHLNPATWELPGARILQVSYEVDEAQALAITPPSCHPSIPPYATFSVMQFPSGPHGLFNLAMVRLIVRAGIRPRGLLLGSYTNNEAAAAALADGWGYHIQLAEVTFASRYELVRGTVSIDGTVALDVSLDDPEPVVGSDLELFDNLHLTNVAGNDPVIVQVDPTYQYTSADRGQPELTVFDADALGISGVEPVYGIVAVSARADMELAAPRFVMDPAVPAIQGTRRLLTS